jgi:hypothetical protein
MIDGCSKLIQTSIDSTGITSPSRDAKHPRFALTLAAGLFVVLGSQVLALARDLSNGNSPRHRSTAIAIIGLFVFCTASAFGNVHSVLIGLDANPASKQTFDYQSRRHRMQLAVDSGVNYLYIHPTWAAIEPAAGSTNL